MKIWYYAKRRWWKYRTTLINFGKNKYFTINVAMSKIIEIEQNDMNKVTLYLFNSISK